MKTWKMIAGNVLSGCVGAALVMGTAQAQKPTPKEPLYEVRTHKLVIVDEHNKERGTFDAFGGGHLRLNSDKSFIDLEASDINECSIHLGQKQHHYCMIDVNDQESGLKLSSGAYSANLEAEKSRGELLLAKNPKINESPGAPPLSLDLLGAGGPKDSKWIQASVDEDNSDINAFGHSSHVWVGSEKLHPFAELNYNLAKNSGSVYVQGADRFQWGQPQMFGENSTK